MRKWKGEKKMEFTIELFDNCQTATQAFEVAIDILQRNPEVINEIGFRNFLIQIIFDLDQRRDSGLEEINKILESRSYQQLEMKKS